MTDMRDAHLWIVEDGLVKRSQLFVSGDALGAAGFEPATSRV